MSSLGADILVMRRPDFPWYLWSNSKPRMGARHMSSIDNPAQSPCIRNCCLDDDLTCLGCFRSIEEIKEWGLVDEDRRRVILQNARQRREAHQVLFTARR